MLRAIAGVVVGYIAMAAALFTTFTGLYLMLGADGSFEPDAWTPSTTWLVMSVVLGLVAAIIGGIVCALIAARGSKATLVLAILVFVLGGLSAAGVMLQEQDPDKPARTSEVGNFDAMMNAESPTWSVLLNPVLGVVGILIGGGLVGKGKPDTGA